MSEERVVKKRTDLPLEPCDVSAVGGSTSLPVPGSDPRAASASSSAPGSSSSTPAGQTDSQSPSTSSGTERPWNLEQIDTALEEKNLFSAMSEEDIEKLESVLSTEEAKKVLETALTTTTPEVDDPDSFIIDEEEASKILETQVKDADILKFATGRFTDHAYCATTRNSNTPVAGLELVDDLREEGDEKTEEGKVATKGKGKKQKGPAPGTRRSTRIQDLEQREEAERIRQQNLEEEQKALEEMAEKGIKHPVIKTYSMRNRKAIDWKAVIMGSQSPRTFSPMRQEEDDTETGNEDVSMEIDEEEDLMAPEGEDLTDNEEVDASTPKKSAPKGKGRLRKVKDSDGDTDSVGGDVVKIVPKFKKKTVGKKAGKGGKKGAKGDDESSQEESDGEEDSSKKKKKTTAGGKKGGAKAAKKTASDKDSSESEGEHDAQNDSEASKKKKNTPKKVKKVTKLGAKQKKTGKNKKSDSGVESEGEDSQTSGKGTKKSATKGMLSPGDSSDDDIPLKEIKDAGAKLKKKKSGKKKVEKKNNSNAEDSDEDDVPLNSLVKKDEKLGSEEEDVESNESDSESSSDPDSSDVNDSEVDPNEPVYCICSKPYNNRFMISCDNCGEWYHGSCIGVTRKMAQNLDKRKQPWECFKCIEAAHDEDFTLPGETKKKEWTERQRTRGGEDESEESGDSEDDEILDEEVREIGDSEKDPKKQKAKRKSAASEDGTENSTDRSRLDSEKDLVIDHEDEAMEQGESEDKKDGDGAKQGASEKSKTTDKEASDKAVIAKQKERLKELKAERKKREEKSSLVTLEEELLKKKPKNRCIISTCANPAKPDSVYCSEQCIAKHADESLLALEQEKQLRYGSKAEPSQPTERVDVFERNGRVVTGPMAPTRATLKSWLQRHPTFQVLISSNKTGQAHGAGAFYSKQKEKEVAEQRRKLKEKRLEDQKRRAEKQKQREIERKKEKELEKQREKAIQKEKERQKERERQREKEKQKDKDVKDKDKEKKEKEVEHHKDGTKEDAKLETSPPHVGPDPVRIKVRKQLKEVLGTRANNADDIMLSSGEIKKIALAIEEQLFKYYADISTKYKTRYRSIIFNLKDPKNEGLFRKVLHGEIKPYKLVRFSSDELASKDLAEWREKETKHTLELIEATEMEKAKKVPADKDKDDLSALVESKIKSTGPVTDYLGSIILDTTEQHKNHFFDLNCKICQNVKKADDVVSKNDAKKEDAVKERKTAFHMKIEPVLSTLGRPGLKKDVKKESESENSVKDGSVKLHPEHRHSKMEQEIMSLSKSRKVSGEDVDKEERNAPTTKEHHVKKESTAEKSEEQPREMYPRVWRGNMAMALQDLSKFPANAYAVSGDVAHLQQELPNTVQVCGRISHDQVWDYLNRIKTSTTREMVVIRFQIVEGEDPMHYNNLYTYFNSRKRCGVVSELGKFSLKDMYILPLASHSLVPEALMPFNGPGLSIRRPNLLLGIIVKQKKSLPPFRDPKLLKQQMQQQQQKPLDQQSKPIDRKPHPAEAPKVKALDPRRRHHQIPPPSEQPLEKRSTTPPLEQLSKEERLKLAAEGYAVPLDDIKIDKTTGRILDDEGKFSDEEDAEEDPETEKIVRQFGQKYPKPQSSVLHEKKTLALPVGKKLESEDEAYDPASAFDDESPPEDEEYDPFAEENMETPTSGTLDSKVKPAVDPVVASKMLIDQLAQKPTAAGMTATMLAALAKASSTPSSGINEQKRLLMELEKKVEEQKKLIEMQKVKLVNETKAAANTTNTGATSAQVPTMVPPPGASLLNQPKIIPLEKDLLEGKKGAKGRRIEEMDTDIPLNIPRRSGTESSHEGKVKLDLDNIEFRGQIDPETGKMTDVDLSKHNEDLSTNLARKRLAKFGAPVTGYYAPPSYNPSATVSKPETSTVQQAQGGALPPAIQKLLSGPQFGALKELVSGLSMKTAQSQRSSGPIDELEKALNLAGGMSQQQGKVHKSMYAEEERKWEQEFGKSKKGSNLKPSYSHNAPSEKTESRQPWEINYSYNDPSPDGSGMWKPMFPDPNLEKKADRSEGELSSDSEDEDDDAPALPGLDLLKKTSVVQSTANSGMPDMDEIRNLFKTGKSIRHLVPGAGTEGADLAKMGESAEGQPPAKDGEGKDADGTKDDDCDDDRRHRKSSDRDRRRSRRSPRKDRRKKRDRSRSRSKDRGRKRSRSRERKRSRDRSKGRRRSRDRRRSRSRDKKRSRSREKHRSKDRDRRRSRSNERKRKEGSGEGEGNSSQNQQGGMMSGSWEGGPHGMGHVQSDPWEGPAANQAAMPGSQEGNPPWERRRQEEQRPEKDPMQQPGFNQGPSKVPAIDTSLLEKISKLFPSGITQPLPGDMGASGLPHLAGGPGPERLGPPPGMPVRFGGPPPSDNPVRFRGPPTGMPGLPPLPRQGPPPASLPPRRPGPPGPEDGPPPPLSGPTGGPYQGPPPPHMSGPRGPPPPHHQGPPPFPRPPGMRPPHPMHESGPRGPPPMGPYPGDRRPMPHEDDGPPPPKRPREGDFPPYREGPERFRERDDRPRGPPPSQAKPPSLLDMPLAPPPKKIEERPPQDDRERAPHGDRDRDRERPSHWRDHHEGRFRDNSDRDNNDPRDNRRHDRDRDYDRHRDRDRDRDQHHESEQERRRPSRFEPRRSPAHDERPPRPEPGNGGGPPRKGLLGDAPPGFIPHDMQDDEDQPLELLEGLSPMDMPEHRPPLRGPPPSGMLGGPPPPLDMLDRDECLLPPPDRRGPPLDLLGGPPHDGPGRRQPQPDRHDDRRPPPGDRDDRRGPSRFDRNERRDRGGRDNRDDRRGPFEDRRVQDDGRRNEPLDRRRSDRDRSDPDQGEPRQHEPRRRFGDRPEDDGRQMRGRPPPRDRIEDNQEEYELREPGFRDRGPPERRPRGPPPPQEDLPIEEHEWVGGPFETEEDEDVDSEPVPEDGLLGAAPLEFLEVGLLLQNMPPGPGPPLGPGPGPGPPPGPPPGPSRHPRGRGAPRGGPRGRGGPPPFRGGPRGPPRGGPPRGPPGPRGPPPPGYRGPPPPGFGGPRGPPPFALRGGPRGRSRPPMRR